MPRIKSYSRTSCKPTHGQKTQTSNTSYNTCRCRKYLISITFSFCCIWFARSSSFLHRSGVVFIHIHMHAHSDLDCKLKSAAQTPAAMHNNLHNNVPEILGRSSVNSSQMYYKTVSAHFASCIIILIFKIVSQSHRFGV